MPHLNTSQADPIGDSNVQPGRCTVYTMPRRMGVDSALVLLKHWCHLSSHLRAGPREMVDRSCLFHRRGIRSLGW